MIKEPYIYLSDIHEYAPTRFYNCPLHNCMVGLGNCQTCNHCSNEYHGTVSCIYGEDE